MNILAIESSCDETAVALLQVKRGRILKLEHMVTTQAIHAKYGGVIPEVAAREHAVTLPYLLAAFAQDVVGEADGHKLSKLVDVVAATRGPGLVTSLRVGYDTARSLALAWNKPLVGVNHIEGHIYANWLKEEKGSAWKFPAVVLVVSGGHTELLLMKDHGKYELLGSTLDDAAGEAFDKTAKLLGFAYPGGPEISKRAKTGNPTAFDFPRPMIKSDDLSFSFSGLKTAVRVFLEKNHDKITPSPTPPQKGGENAFIADVCASLETAIVDVLVAKTKRAVIETGVKNVMLAGGVAANGYLREQLKIEMGKLEGVEYSDPPLKYCTDNAAMIAAAAYFKAEAAQFDDAVLSDADPAWELGLSSAERRVKRPF